MSGRYVSVIFDVDETSNAYRYTVDALEHAIADRAAPVDVVVQGTDAIGDLGAWVLLGPGEPISRT